MPAPLRKRKSLSLRIVGVPLTFAIFVTTFTIFRTSSLGNAAAYFAGILHNPGHEVFAQYWLLGLTSKLELLLLLLGIALLVLVDVLHECGLHLRAWVNAAPRPVRWAVYEFAILPFADGKLLFQYGLFVCPVLKSNSPWAVPIKGAAWGSVFCLCGKYKKGDKALPKLLIPRPQISCPRPCGYHTSVGSGQCFAAGYKCCCGACQWQHNGLLPESGIQNRSHQREKSSSCGGWPSSSSVICSAYWKSGR